MNILLGLCLFIIFSGVANAVEFSVPESVYSLHSTTQKSKSQHRLSEIVYRQFQPIQKQISAESYNNALSSLNRLAQRHKEKPYVTSIAMQSAAYVYIAQERYPKAMHWMQAILKLSSMNIHELQSIRHNLSQLQLQAEQYKDAATTMTQWLENAKAEQINASDYQLLAVSYFQLEQYKKSKQTAKKGLKLSKQPLESLYQLILSCDIALKQYTNAEQTLATLIKLKPAKKSYWIQWVGILDLQEKTKQALVVFELMDQQNMLKHEDEHIQFVQRLMQHNNAHKAAKKLNTYIKNTKISNTPDTRYLLASAWQQSGETTKAAKLLTNLKHKQALTRLTQIYASEQQWLNVTELLESELKTPVTTESETLFIQLGYAYNQLGELSKARQIFITLFKAEQTSHENRRVAKEWMVYLDQF